MKTIGIGIVGLGYVEKYIALTVDGCDNMIDAASRNKVHLMVGHMMRFYDGIKLTKQFIDSDGFGIPVVAHSERTG